MLTTSYQLLAKSLLPLPSEHFGIHDEETRLRKRYLDILSNDDTKQLFIKSKVLELHARLFANTRFSAYGYAYFGIDNWRGRGPAVYYAP